MTTTSNTLTTSSSWDTICFPVRAERLCDYLPNDFQVLASDRRRIVVGDLPNGAKGVFAVQSEDYSIVPNALIRSVVEQEITRYEMNIRASHKGEYNINIILPDIIQVGGERLHKNLIFNNSYTGKTPFTIQGMTVNTRTRRESRVRVSYYRKVCSNGLMGWVDSFLSMDEYLNWLIAGKPKKYEDARDERTSIEEVVHTETDKEMVVEGRFTHKHLELDWLTTYLKQTIRAFLTHEGSLTAQVYERLAQTSLEDHRVETVLAATKLPKMLAKLALERMQYEERLLKSEPTLWLVYNAVNYALHQGDSSLTISERFKADEAALHRLVALTLN
ncbi:hypothetical protein GCM10023187_52530 [Nibrella viscosa]|uniref:DUF932 domain-containing protein n=1 Tax=Nibrella viscosa TaxID=1084524 RepID=A0ABP8KYU2_9BACT